MIKGYFVGGAFAAGLLFGAIGNGWRLNSKIDRMVSDHATASKVAAFRSIEKTTEIQRAKDDEVTKANDRARVNAVNADAVRAENERLRVQLARSRTAFASASTASLVDHANTLSVVFEHCTREYSGMAAKADGHASDSQSLFDAWSAIAKIK